MVQNTIRRVRENETNRRTLAVLLSVNSGWEGADKNWSAIGAGCSYDQYAVIAKTSGDLLHLLSLHCIFISRQPVPSQASSLDGPSTKITLMKHHQLQGPIDFILVENGE